VEKIDINGKEFTITRILSKNRNARARLRDYNIVISLPSRWSIKDREKIGGELEQRAIRSIQKGTWNPETNRKLQFFHGQKINAMGNEFTVIFVPSSRFGAKIIDDRLEINIDYHDENKEKKISYYARREIIKKTENRLLNKIKDFNEKYFQTQLKNVRIRETTSIWGSCSPHGRISLNFRLLLLPEEILDYVIVHELAHTKYRGHGPRFWGVVEKIIPNHKERRKWLRKNGWKIN